ncbi:polyprotein, partial [Lettuce secovirus 1]
SISKGNFSPGYVSSLSFFSASVTLRNCFEVRFLSSLLLLFFALSCIHSHYSARMITTEDCYTVIHRLLDMGYDMDESIALYQQCKIEEIRASFAPLQVPLGNVEVAEKFQHHNTPQEEVPLHPLVQQLVDEMLYADQYNYLGPIIAPIDTDTDAEEIHNLIPVPDDFFVLSQNCEVIDLARAEAYASPIFPLTPTKVKILTGSNPDAINKLVKISIQVEEARMHEQTFMAGAKYAAGMIATRVSFGWISGGSTAVKALADCATMLKQIFEKIIHAFDFVASTVESFTTFVTGIRDKVIEMASSAWQKLEDLGDHFFYLIPMFSCLFLVASAAFLINSFLALVAPTYCFSSSTIVQLIIVCCVMVGFKELASAIIQLGRGGQMTLLTVIFNAVGVNYAEENPNHRDREFEEIIETQSNITEQTGAAATGFFGLLSLLTFFTSWELKYNIKDMANMASNFSKLSDGFTRFKQISENVAFYVYEKLGLRDRWDSGAAQSMLLATGARFQDWCMEVESLDAKMTTAVSLSEDLAKVRRLKDTGLKIQHFMSSDTNTVSFMMRERLKVSLQSLETNLKRFERAVDLDGSRICPFSLLFTGAPAAGKSNAMRSFIHDTLNDMGEPTVGRVYPRNSGDKYWTNYLRHTAVFYDEFAQHNPTPDHSDELELIPLVSCNPYPLNGAAIEDKGITFNSKYIFMCSNRADISPGAGIADHDAFRRRRHLVVWVEKDERPFDPTNPMYNQTFTLRDPMNPKNPLLENINGELQETPPMSYDELRVYTVNKMKEHFDREDKSLAFSESRRNAAQIFEQVGPEHFRKFSAQAMSNTVPNMSNLGQLDIEEHEIYGTFKEVTFCCGRDGKKCTHDIAPSERCVYKQVDKQVKDEDYEIALTLSLLEQERNITDIQSLRLMVEEFTKYDANPVSKNAEFQNFVDNTWLSLSDRTRFLICIVFKHNDGLREKIKKKSTAILDEIKTWRIAGAWNTLPFSLQWTIGMIALVGFGYGIFSLVRGLLSIRSMNPIEMMGFITGTGTIASMCEQTSYGASGANEGAPIYRHRRLKAYQQSDHAAIELTVNQSERIETVKKSQGLLLCTGLGGSDISIPVLVGHDHTLFITTHEMKLINFSKSCLLMMRDETTYTIFINPKNVIVGEKGGIKDAVCAIKISTLYAMPKACTTSIDFDFAENLDGKRSAFIVPHAKKDYDQKITKSYVSRQHEVVDVMNEKGQVAWKAHNLLKVTANNFVGLCGRLLLVNNVADDLRVVGMHVSGMTTTVPVSFFGELNGIHGPKKGVYQQTSEVDFFEFAEPEQITEMVDKLGFVGPRQNVRLAGKSAIIKSEIHDHLWREPETAPTIISRHDPRSPYPFDPYASGIRKFVKEAGSFSFDDGTEESIVLRDIKEELATHRDSTKGFKLETVLSTDQAINGVEGVAFAERLIMSTSEGYPYVLDRTPGQTGKWRFFDQEGENWKLKSEANDELNNLEQSIKQDDFDGKLITVACAKDEKTKLKKIFETPKTRIFEILPFHYNILVRKYFLFFMQFIMEAHQLLPCRVGLNVYGRGWDTMHGEHARFANHFNGDYSGFDTGTPRDLLVAIADMISDIACDGCENKIVRRNLMRMAVDRRILVGSEIYSVKGGTPSGFALTVIVNSLVNQFYLMLSWRLIVRKVSPSMMPYRIMKTHVTFSVYGDDNVVSFDNQVRDAYNLVTIAETLKQFGITLSDGKKTGILEKWTTIDNIDFLKRKWVLSNGVGFLCPLEKSAIEERLFWIRQSDDCLENLDDNTHSALMEAFHHGIGYFQFLRNEIASAYRRANLPVPLLLHYEEARLIWLEQRENSQDNIFLASIERENLPNKFNRNTVREVTFNVEVASIQAYNTRKSQGHYDPIKIFLSPQLKGNKVDIIGRNRVQYNIPYPDNLNFCAIINDLCAREMDHVCFLSGDGGPKTLAYAFGYCLKKKLFTEAYALTLLASMVGKETEFYSVQALLALLN